MGGGICSRPCKEQGSSAADMTRLWAQVWSPGSGWPPSPDPVPSVTSTPGLWAGLRERELSCFSKHSAAAILCPILNGPEMERADWFGLGPVSTPLEEQGPGVGEISPKVNPGAISRSWRKRWGPGRDSCLEPELLFPSMSQTHGEPKPRRR